MRECTVVFCQEEPVYEGYLATVQGGFSMPVRYCGEHAVTQSDKVDSHEPGLILVLDRIGEK